jgi:hypothetical protein
MRQIKLEELKQLALQAKDSLWNQAQNMGRDVKLYLHWSAGHYGQLFEDYHINIDQDGSIRISIDNLAAIKPHTYMRNTGAIGIALACCDEATTNDLGPEPPTTAQIESMSQVIAVLCETLDLTCDIYRVMTHAEAADNLDGYNPGYTDYTGYPNNTYGPVSNCQRWDLWILKTGDVPGSGGNTLRGKAIWYQQQGL